MTHLACSGCLPSGRQTEAAIYSEAIRGKERVTHACSVTIKRSPVTTSEQLLVVVVLGWSGKLSRILHLSCQENRVLEPGAARWIWSRLGLSCKPKQRWQCAFVRTPTRLSSVRRCGRLNAPPISPLPYGRPASYRDMLSWPEG